MSIKNNNTKKPKSKSRSSFLGRIVNKLLSFINPQILLSIGFLLFFSAIFIFISLLSYLFTGQEDMSIVLNVKEGLVDKSIDIQNWFGYYAAFISHYLMFGWFGVGSFIIPLLLFLLGIKIIFKRTFNNFNKFIRFSSFILIISTFTLGFLTENSPEAFNKYDYITGRLGREFSEIMTPIFGWGSLLVLALIILVFFTFVLDWKPIDISLQNIIDLFSKKLKNNLVKDETEKYEENYSEDLTNSVEQGVDESVTLEVNNTAELSVDVEVKEKENDNNKIEISDDLEFEVETTLTKDEEEKQTEYKDSQYESAPPPDDAEKVLVEQENYDPTKSLSQYKFPSVELLEFRDVKGAEVSNEELQENKEKILKTLSDFKIGISKIKATIGPTVTLYEIVPEAGNKISKIRNLVDDIALNLAALGIRMIAPIPGKGTIGIEVPNKNREMVSARSVMQTDKFLKNKKELPIVLGKTISNEVFVVDLSKMPHLLIAGATGQGKSVGINIVLASLVYKKHPSQLKFILIDPKKVELSLYKKMEKHFLAQLPDAEEAIITDTKKVIYTLNSLCIEMDKRYDLLKMAEVRQIKEYNEKFITRKLNPQNGHEYLPYLVLVIDELADLMMTAGKEIEAPIGRLAQLARAVGIHLVLATQRPSVNVITGVIKANFPARLSFKVTSAIDSKTILDQSGANQLIGQGDMLLSMNSEIVRLQCAFIDTNEVENLCHFIGNQLGYETPYYLPEYSDEEISEGITIEGFEIGTRDEKFLDAAFIVVDSQKGSTSNLQRKLDLGYNRAGRIMDQLEKDNIVGPQEATGKPRKVLISNRIELEELLRLL